MPPTPSRPYVSVLLATVDRIALAKRDRSRFRDGHIEAIPVVHLVKLTLWLEFAKFGIGQHGICSARARNTMIEKLGKFAYKDLNFNKL